MTYVDSPSNGLISGVNYTATPFSSLSQWTTSGNNIYNANSGNVGIGVSNPSAKLEVNGNVTASNFNGKTLSGTGLSCTKQIASSSVSAEGEAYFPAVCPSSYTLTGGGCSAAFDSRIFGSYPQNNNWYCYIYNAKTLSITVYAYAVCCNVN